MSSNRFAALWTEGSIFCYERGCNCRGCFVQDLIKSQKCLMKTAVIELVRKYGVPEKKPIFTPTEQEFINKILEGCNSFEEVGEKINKKASAVANTAHIVYKKAREYYGWKPIKRGLVTNSLLPQFINWVRNGGLDNEAKK